MLLLHSFMGTLSPSATGLYRLTPIYTHTKMYTVVRLICCHEIAKLNSLLADITKFRFALKHNDSSLSASVAWHCDTGQHLHMVTKSIKTTSDRGKVYVMLVTSFILDYWNPFLLLAVAVIHVVN